MDDRGLQKEVISEKDAADRKFAEVVAKAEAEAKHHRVKLMSHVVVGRSGPGYCRFHRVGRLRSTRNRVQGAFGALSPDPWQTTDRLVELVPCAVLVVK